MYATFNVLVSSGASVYHRSFSMKESWKFSKEKLVSAEEGLISAEPVTRESICSCHRLIQCAKLVLYVELILFLGWSSYTLWQAYDLQGDIKFFKAICPDYAATRDIEASKILNEVLTELPLKVVEDSTDKIKIKENGPSQEAAFPTKEVSPTNAQLNAPYGQVLVTSEDHLIADSTESSASNEDEEIESLENRPVFDWGFPFLWNIHQDNTPFTDDSRIESRQKLDESLEEALKHLYESDEKEGTNPVLESRQTSSEDKREESNFSSDDFLSSAEIINRLIKRYEQNLKVIIEDSYVKTVGDMSLEKEENSKMDVGLTNSTQESIDGFPISEESTESSIVFPHSSTSEELPINFPWENFGSGSFSHVSLSERMDKTTTHSPSNFWDEQYLQPFIDWRTWRNNFEVNPLDESTEGNTYEEMSAGAASAEGYSLEWKPPITIYLSLSQKQDDGLEQETLQNHWPFSEFAKEKNISDTDLSNEKSDFHSTVINSDDETIETSTGWEDSSVLSEIAESELRDFVRDWSDEVSTESSQSESYQSELYQSESSQSESSQSESYQLESSQSESSQSELPQSELFPDDWLQNYYDDFDR